jgi:hypothetical protein
MKKKNRRVHVSIARTINTGNYESIKVSAGIGFDISDKVKEDEAFDEAFEEVTKQLLNFEDKVLGEK